MSRYNTRSWSDHGLPGSRLSVSENRASRELTARRQEKRTFGKPTSRELRGSPTAKHQCNPIPPFAISPNFVNGVLRIEGILLQHQLWCNCQYAIRVLEHVPRWLVVRCAGLRSQVCGKTEPRPGQVTIPLLCAGPGRGGGGRNRSGGGYGNSLGRGLVGRDSSLGSFLLRESGDVSFLV